MSLAALNDPPVSAQRRVSYYARHPRRELGMDIEWATRYTFCDSKGETVVEHWTAPNEEIARSNTEWVGPHAETVFREVTEWKEAR